MSQSTLNMTTETSSNEESRSAMELITTTPLESTTSESSTEVENSTMIQTTTSEICNTSVTEELTKCVFSSSISSTTTDTPGNDGLKDGIVIAAVLGAFVLVVFTISLIINTQKRPSKVKYEAPKDGNTEKKFIYTRTALYDEIDPDIEIKVVSTAGPNIEEEKATQHKQDVTVESNPYVDCPANVYDKTFSPRPCVYELQRNIYHTVDTCADDVRNIKAN